MRGDYRVHYGVDTRKSKRINAAFAVRWLGAYRGYGQHTLFESIAYELTRKDEAAAEPFFKVPTGYTDSLARGLVGLLIKRSAIFRVFPKDCWSEYGDPKKGQNPGKLFYTRVREYSDHSECWVNMDDACEGIVIQGHITCLHGSTQKQIRAAAKKLGLNIYILNKGKLTLYEE